MTTYERALQIYPVLIAAAQNRQVLNYKIVGNLIGVPAQGLANHLGHLMRYCKRHGLPPLTALVVKKDSGRPGHGLTTVDDLNRDIERIFSYPWFRRAPLTLADLQND